MKILILPSHRLMLYSSKLTLTLLPEYLKAEQYSVLPSANLIAMLHYKTVSLFRVDALRELGEAVKLGKTFTKVLPELEEALPKKIAVIDLYQKSVNGQTVNKCLLSDKFGDLYLLPLTKQSHSPVYLNSNLGIPNYIHYLETPKSEYLLLSDEQNRIKIYNSKNPHQLLSFWFLINKSSIECQILYPHSQSKQPFVVMLMRFQNKQTLENDVRIQYFVGNQEQLQADQYPGVEVKSYNKFSKQCQFYTMIPCSLSPKTPKNSILLLYLFPSKLSYQLFTITQQNTLKSKLVGQIPIEQGKWDYLHAIDTEQNDTILVTYGTDVEMPIQIDGNKNQENFSFGFGDRNGVSLNKYEKIVKIQLKV